MNRRFLNLNFLKSTLRITFHNFLRIILILHLFSTFEDIVSDPQYHAEEVQENWLKPSKFGYQRMVTVSTTKAPINVYYTNKKIGLVNHVKTTQQIQEAVKKNKVKKLFALISGIWSSAIYFFCNRLVYCTCIFKNFYFLIYGIPYLKYQQSTALGWKD